MKKISSIALFIVSLLASVSSCASCERKDVLPDGSTTFLIEDADISETQNYPQDSSQDSSQDYKTFSTVYGSTWSVQLPIGWEPEELEINKSEMVYRNIVSESLVYLLKEDFTGSQEEYTLFAVRGLKERGSTIVDSGKVVINNVKYDYLHTEKGIYTTWFFITTQNKFGYALVCGGKTNDLSTKLDCDNISQSLTIK